MTQKDPIDVAVDDIVRSYNKALQKAIASAHAEARREALEEAADAANGIDPEILAGKSEAFVSIYCRSRVDAANAIMARIGGPKP